MRRVKIYSSLFWLLFAVVVCFQASRLAMGELHQPGPGFFPFTLGLLTGVLALIALFQSIRDQEKRAVVVRKERFRWWNLVVIFGALIAYALTLERFGFLVNTFLLISLMLKVVEPQSWKTAILGGLITAVASEFVFNVILGAQIPSGVLGF